VSKPAQPVPLPDRPDSQAWGDIVEKFGFTGVARQVAAECEIETWDGEHIELRVAKAQERWLEKGYGDRIKAALKKQFGDALQVTIRVGVPDGSSPAAIAERERARQQAKAVAEIEQDPFVRDLVDNFGARVNEDSIKPIQ
jgi:DNA polymerase-3 subunit gamma/tau